MYYKCNAFDEAGRTCLYDNRMIMIANTTASIHDCQIEQHGHDLHKMYEDREISPFLTIHVYICTINVLLLMKREVMLILLPE